MEEAELANGPSPDETGGFPKGAVVRLLDTGGKPCGIGLMVSAQNVITCAHVVAEALGASHPAIHADDRKSLVKLKLEFPFIGGHRVAAHIHRWYPDETLGAKDGLIDIAVLRLSEEAPSGAKVAVFADAREKDDFLGYGVPASDPHRGSYAEGVVLGPLPNYRTSLAIGSGDEQNRVQPGFSGSGVWVPRLAAFAGLIVTARDDRTRAEMIPTAVLRRAYERLPSPQAKLEAPRMSNVGPRVIYLIDREDPSSRVGQSIKAAESAVSTRKSPLMILIKGLERENHYAFIHRLEDKVYPQHAKPNDAPHVVELSWPHASNGGGGVEALKLALKEAISALDTTPAAVCGQLNEQRKSFAFVSHIWSRYAVAGDAAVVRDWTAYWREVSDAGLQQVVVLLLCLHKYVAPRRTWRTWFERRADDLIANAAAEHGWDTAELSPVPLSSVADWLQGPVSQWVPETRDRVPLILREVRELYGDRPAVHMDDLLGFDTIKAFQPG